MSRIVGLPDEPTPRPVLLDFVHPKDRTRVRSALSYSATFCRPFSVAIRLVTVDGEFRVVRVAGAPVYHFGECIAIAGTAIAIVDGIDVETNYATAFCAHEGFDG